jgi:hypothetical protein
LRQTTEKKSENKELPDTSRIQVCIVTATPSHPVVCLKYGMATVNVVKNKIKYQSAYCCKSGIKTTLE